MAMDVTLVLKRTYETGRESGERWKSAKRGRFVRAHWFENTGRIDPEIHVTRLQTKEELG